MILLIKILSVGKLLYENTDIIFDEIEIIQEICDSASLDARIITTNLAYMNPRFFLLPSAVTNIKLYGYTTVYIIPDNSIYPHEDPMKFMNYHVIDSDHIMFNAAYRVYKIKKLLL